MDVSESTEWWAERWPGDDINIMVFVDGGRRKDGRTASALCGFCDKRWIPKKFFGKGAHFGNDQDSFIAECRSMQLASSRVRAVLEQHGR